MFFTKQYFHFSAFERNYDKPNTIFTEAFFKIKPSLKLMIFSQYFQSRIACYNYVIYRLGVASRGIKNLKTIRIGEKPNKFLSQRPSAENRKKN